MRIVIECSNRHLFYIDPRYLTQLLSSIVTSRHASCTLAALIVPQLEHTKLSQSKGFLNQHLLIEMFAVHQKRCLSAASISFSRRLHLLSLRIKSLLNLSNADHQSLLLLLLLLSWRNSSVRDVYTGRSGEAFCIREILCSIQIVSESSSNRGISTRKRFWSIQWFIHWNLFWWRTFSD